MNRPEKKRWVALAVIWGLVGGLVAYNVVKAEEIAGEQLTEEKQLLRARYLAEKLETLQEAHRARGKLSDVAPSAELGVLAVGERLRLTAQTVGIPFVAVTAQASKGGSPRELNAVYVGSFEQLVAWLNVLSAEAPYLAPTSLKAKAEPLRGGMRMEVGFSYTFEISEPDDAPQTEVASAGGAP